MEDLDNNNDKIMSPLDDDADFQSVPMQEDTPVAEPI